MEPILTPETITLLILGLVGIVICLLEQMENAQKLGEKFTFKGQWIRTALTILLTALCIILREDIKEFYVVTKIGAVIVGYTGGSFLFAAIKSKAPKA